MDKPIKDMFDIVAGCAVAGRPEKHARTGKDMRVLETIQPGGAVIALRIPEFDFKQPPRIFEHRTGMTGIGCDYALPGGLSARDLETGANAIRHAHMKKWITPRIAAQDMDAVYALIAARNPQLAALDFDRKNADQFYDVLMGIASAFSVADIQCYLDTPPGDRRGTLQQDPAYDALWTKVEAAVGNVGWIPSAATLRRIEAQISLPRRPGPPKVW